MLNISACLCYRLKLSLNTFKQLYLSEPLHRNRTGNKYYFKFIY